MKKYITIPALAAMTLMSCGTSTPTETPAAYQIFKMIDPKNADIQLEPGTDTTAKDVFSYSVFMDDYYEGETVQCLSHDNGGCLVIHQKWADGAVDGYSNNGFNLYLYQDGKLTERNDLLPAVTVDDFAAVDAVSLYNVPKSVKDRFTINSLNISYDTEQSPSMLMYSSYVYKDDIQLYFKWDGTKFAPSECESQTRQFNLLTTAGIGRIFVGDKAPDQLAGFQKKMDGNTAVFSRDGKPHFQLSLSDDGKIDTITILSDRYTYCMDVDGPTNDHYGIGFSNIEDGIGYGLFKGQYIVMKDGVWVRVITEKPSDYNITEMFDEDTETYPHDGVIEFYTTPNAITNIQPENGKKVDYYTSSPKYDENATVTLVKIYKGQPDIGLDIFHQLIEIHKKEGDKNPLLNYYDNADKYYYDNKKANGFHLNDYGSVEIYNHAFKYYPRNGGGYKVYEYVAMEHGNRYDYRVDPFDERRIFSCFVYKDGTLTPATLEPDIPSDLHRTPTPFTDNGISVYGTEYVWNGEHLVPANSDENRNDIKTTYGDINQDGIKDVIGFTKRDLTVCILDDNDVATYNKTFMVQDEYSNRLITDVTIDDKGVVVIKTTWTNERGADGDDYYTVRFQDGDLYLIGYDTYYKPATNVSYNLLTYKKIKKEGLNDNDSETTTEDLKNHLPLHKLSDIKIGEYICDDYDGLE